MIALGLLEHRRGLIRRPRPTYWGGGRLMSLSISLKTRSQPKGKNSHLKISLLG